MINRSCLTFCCVVASYGLLLAGCAAPMQKVKVPQYEKPVPEASRPIEQPREETESFGQRPVESAQTAIAEQNRQMESEALQPERKVRQGVDKIEPLNRERIAQRLKVYEDKLWDWQSLEEQLSLQEALEGRPSGWYACLMQLERLASTYSQLSGMDASSFQSEDLEERYWLDIDYLESSCEEVYETAKAELSAWSGHFVGSKAEQLEASVKYYAENGMTEEALQAYHNLTATFPDHFLKPAVRKIFCLALVRGGKLAQAVSFLQESLKDMELQQDILILQRKLADLLLATGKVDEARGQYQRLAEAFNGLKGDDLWVADQLAVLGNIEGYSEELAAFIDIMQSYITFDGRHVPADLSRKVERIESYYPTSILANRARNILWQAEDQASSWIGRELVKVDELIASKEYQQSIGILEELLKEELTPEVRDVVQKTLDDAAIAEAEEQETKQRIIEQAKQMQLDEATRLFELRKYDDAIAAFTLLRDTEYGEEAQEKIRQAANLAAADMRRTAANLFVKARRTGSPDQRKELMFESWELLSRIPQKYPDAEILGKVAENIKILEDQIKILEPELFEEIQERKEAFE